MFTMTLTSCNSLFSFTTVADQAVDIQPNMTMDDVLRIMGKPYFRSFERDLEKWEYRTRLLDDDYNVVAIVFHDGRVTSMNSFREVHPKLPAPPPAKKAE